MAEVTEARRAPKAGPAGPQEEQGWRWGTRTWPFSVIGEPYENARFVIEQVGDACFALPDGGGFQYNGAGPGYPAVVTQETLKGTTDLASIPRFMGWFVSRYGRHTPAVLVHDMRVEDDMDLDARIKADNELLEMMTHLDVPVVRRRVMWAAVTVATRWKGNVLARLGIILWGLLAAGGVALLARGIATGTAWQIALALLAPFPASLLWGSQRTAGLVGGLAMPFVIVPAAASWFGYGVYWLVEETIRRVLALHPRNDLEMLPTPTPYKER